MMKKTSLIALFCMISSVFLFMPVQAGDANHPDFEDSDGDAPLEEQDIISGWMGDEKNDTINVVLQMVSLPAFTSPGDVPNFPTTEYRIYFTVGQGYLRTNYVAVAKVPIRGPFGLTLSYQVCSHVYNGTEPGELTGCTSTTGNYASNVGQVNFTIDKSDIGSPVEGDLAEDMWGEVYFSQKGSGFNLTTPERVDRGPDSGFGDGKWVFRGTSANVYRVYLSADHTVENATAVKPAEFQLTVMNNGTSRLSVELHNTTGAGWTVQLTPATVTVDSLANKTVLVKVTPKDLRTLKNGDTFSCQVWGTYRTEENDTKESENRITFVTTAELPAPPKTKEDPFAGFLKELKKNMNTIIMLIVVLVVVGIVYKVARGGMLKRKEKKMEEARMKEGGGNTMPERGGPGRGGIGVGKGPQSADKASR